MAKSRTRGNDSEKLLSLEELDNVPLVVRARTAILNAILEDRFGGRLPAEDKLAAMLNVSRTTVRSAVQGLERDGLISRRRAIGTTINQHVGPRTLALQRLVGFDWLLKERGHEVRVDIRWERMTPPPSIQRAVPWDDPVECFATEKQYFADESLAIYLRDFIPWANLKRDSIADPLEPSVFEFSRRHCTQPITHAVVEIVPLVKTKKAGTKLPGGTNEPFIRLHETLYARDAAIVGWSFVDVEDRFIRLEVFRGH